MSTIISGKASKKKLFTIICIFFAIALLSFAAYAYNFKLDLNETLYWITHSKNPKTGTVVKFAPQLGDFFLYGLTFPFTLGVSFINMLLEILWISLPLVAVVLFFKMKNSEIAVSDTFVTGKHSFAKNANFPVGKITSVGVGKFSSVVVAVGSEKYKFWLLENNQKIVGVISEKIQTKETGSNTGNSSATEIQKYKELFDQGVITAEEFEAKKKQLLGL